MIIFHFYKLTNSNGEVADHSLRISATEVVCVTRWVSIKSKINLRDKELVRYVVDTKTNTNHYKAHGTNDTRGDSGGTLSSETTEYSSNENRKTNVPGSNPSFDVSRRINIHGEGSYPDNNPYNSSNKHCSVVDTETFITITTLSRHF